MIINNNLNQASVGFEESSQMTIKQKNLGKIYRLLTTSSYKDSYGSIIREFSSNAVDSNVSAGKLNEPVIVKYNIEENSISIIDNGLGMSEEFIRDVYMSLGDSTKDRNEFQIGGWGIGSKSIFSYTTHYTLISRYNGEIKTYIISESEDLPDALLVNTELTDECNGVEIKFEVKSGDYSRFKTACENQLKYFEHVIIEGFGINNDYNIIRGNHFAYRPDRNNYTGKLEVLWGQVGYPIDFNFLNIPPININCAIYFPQNTPFQPEAARENLRNTDVNKELILKGIEETRKELFLLWKSQQLVDSFFEWKNKNSKTVDLNGHTLNISAFIEEEFIYTPLVNTNIDSKKFKSWVTNVFKFLFFYRQNSRAYTSLDHIGKDSNVYHVSDCATPSSAKLAKAGWKAYISQRTSLNYFDLVERLYKESDVKVDFVNGGRTILSPKNIDWKAEIDLLESEIWKEITSKTKDLRIMSFKSERSTFSIESTEIRGKFSTVYGNKWEIRDLSWINKYRYVVYTCDEKEYDKLCNIVLEGYSSKKGKRFRVTNYYLVILTTKKYFKRLSHCYTYESFMKSNVMGAYYTKWYRESLKGGYSRITLYEAVHKMYEHKYKDLKDSLQKKNVPYIDPNLQSELAELFSTDHIDEQYKRALKKYNELEYSYDFNSLFYMLLYKYNKKQLNKLKNV